MKYLLMHVLVESKEVG